MDVRVSDILRMLAEAAPWELQEVYDNSGLLIGDPDMKVGKILVAIDVNEEVVSEALQKGCNLIISHHPLIFKGLKRISSGTGTERSVILAIRHGLAIASYHTNIDNIETGVNGVIAQKFGLLDTRVLLPRIATMRKLVVFCPVSHVENVRLAMFDAGAGHIGEYDSCSFNSEGFGTFRAGDGANPFAGQIGVLHQEPEIRIETIVPAFRLSQAIKSMIAAHPYEEVAYDVYPLENQISTIGSGMIGRLPQPLEEGDFLLLCREVFGTACLRHNRFTDKRIVKVAVCGGSGAFLIGDAASQFADAFVTADIKYHDFFDAPENLLVVDAGHYETEQYTKELIRDIIVKKIPTFAPLISEVKTNPVHYFT